MRFLTDQMARNIWFGCGDGTCTAEACSKGYVHLCQECLGGARAPDPPEVGQPVPPQDGGPEAGGAGTAAEEAGEEPALLEPKGGVTKAVREALQGTSFKVWDPLDKNGDAGSDPQAQAGLDPHGTPLCEGRPQGRGC